MSVLNKPHFQNEEAAFATLEAILWPNGPICPHCGGRERVYTLQGVKDKKGRVRPGLKKCGHCRKQFTVRVGTVFESSHVKLHIWLQAVHLMCSSKKGISRHQLHRTLGVTYQTAWFMSHRIRQAMRSGALAPMGGNGGFVEIDETTQGRTATAPPRKEMIPRVYGGWAHRNVVLALVERGGEVRNFHVSGTSIAELMPVIRANVRKGAAVMTDGAIWYKFMNKDGEFASHDRVDHSQGEYVRYETGRVAIHTNTVEGYFSVFKRGMKGVYQHCSEKHLHR
jgi:transposase-like protein